MKSSKELLGMRIDVVDKKDVLLIIRQWIGRPYKQALKQIITAYSEFFVRAGEDEEFKKAWDEADLVLPDGIGVLAGLAYLEGERVWSVIGRALGGRLGETVTGVWLSEELVKLANKKKWRVFLLGGFGKTAERLVKKLRLTNSNLQIDFDKGEERLRENDSKDRQVIEKINKFAPDILLVAYGPGKQEKWIYKNKENLKAKIAIGVGGTFDELLDDSLRSPKWMERRGLKWLWRLIRQPRRLIRIYRAVVVFPWLVFRRHGR